MQGVINHNRALFVRARELNVRAGREVFPIPSREQLAELLFELLGGATRIADISNLEALRLPEWDAAGVADVLAKYPNTIMVCGREVTVEYRSGGYNPRMRLDFRGDESRNWLKLPDDGIHLPDGREISMYSSLEGYGYYIESDSSQFKAKARECLNQGLWSQWQKPELPAPTESIAPVVEAEYGRCVVTNVSLVAFGVFQIDYYGRFVTHWTRDRAEADKVHAQACAKFLEVKEKSIRDALKKRVGELYSAHNYNREIAEETRTRMYNTYYGYSGGATTVAEIDAFIAEVEAAVAAIEERKVEAERQKREVEASRQKKVVAGHARIETINVRREALGWDRLWLSGDEFWFNERYHTLDNLETVAEAEAEVEREEQRRTEETKRDQEMRARPASTDRLAALAAKFKK